MDVSPPTLAAHRASTFAELLEPIGLFEKYGAAFEASRIPFEVSTCVGAPM